MMPSLSHDLKRRMVAWYFEEGLTYRAICEWAQCSIRLVSKVLHNFREHGEVTNPFTKRTGRPSMIEDADIEYISALLDANPLLYLNEIQRQMTAARNKTISIASLARLVVQYGLMRKQVQKAAAERDEEL